MERSDPFRFVYRHTLATGSTPFGDPTYRPVDESIRISVGSRMVGQVQTPFCWPLKRRSFWLLPRDLVDRYAIRLDSAAQHIYTSYSIPDELWLAFDQQSTVYGTGASEQDAVNDYFEQLMAHAQWLRDNRANIGGPLLEEYRALHKLFVNLP